MLFVMDTKLTLKLDKKVVEGAKEYATAHNKSLSRMIESYLKSLLKAEDNSHNQVLEITPFVKNLKSGVKIPNDFDEKKGYGDYLIEKYK
jgi:hypothetical protein